MDNILKSSKIMEVRALWPVGGRMPDTLWPYPESVDTTGLVYEITPYPVAVGLVANLRRWASLALQSLAFRLWPGVP